MNVCVWVEAKSCLAFHVGSEMFLQSISKIKSMCLLILQGLLSQCSDVDFDIHWAFLVGNPVFVLCLGESSSFLPEEWMEHCVCVVWGCPILTCETLGTITASFVRGTMFLCHCFPNSLASTAVHAVLLPLLPCVCCLSTRQHFQWKRNLVPHSEAGNAAH